MFEQYSSFAILYFSCTRIGCIGTKDTGGYLQVLSRESSQVTHCCKIVEGISNSIGLGVTFGANVDSARNNLAASFVNGFVNAGFGKDKLVVADGETSNSFVYKTKDHGKSYLYIDVSFPKLSVNVRHDQFYCLDGFDSALGC